MTDEAKPCDCKECRDLDRKHPREGRQLVAVALLRPPKKRS